MIRTCGVLFILVACGASEAQTATNTTATSAPLSSAPVASFVEPATSVPRSSRALPPAPMAGVHITLTPTDLRVGNTHVEVPADDTYHLIAPLAAALPPNAHEAVLAVDPSVTNRAVIRVLYTLGQHEITLFHFVVSHDSVLGTIDITPSPPTILGSRPPPKSGITALPFDGGISLKAVGGNIMAGCAEVGAGVAVPKKNGAHDFVELARCSDVLINTGAFTDTVTIMGGPNVDFQTVVTTIDTLAKNFPHVQFALPR